MTCVVFVIPCTKILQDTRWRRCFWELQFLDSATRVPGQTLTGVEKRYRTQWIAAMHAVMQHVSLVLLLIAVG